MLQWLHGQLLSAMEGGVTMYKYGNIATIGLGTVQITVAKIENGELVATRRFNLRLHPCPEGQDPVAIAIAKHRDTLTNW